MFVCGKIISQCNFIPLLNDDYNLPGYAKASYSSIARDTLGRIFVASVDMDNFACPVVHMFDGNKWKKLGRIYNNGGSQNLKIAVDDGGTPYVAFRDGNNGLKLSVLKYTAGVWNYVGTGGISVGPVWTLDIKIDKNGFPIVVYEEQGGPGSVKKFNGTSWSYVGSQYLSTGYMADVSLELDTADVPYVGYGDGLNGLKAAVKKFDGTNWVTVGPQPISLSGAGYIDLEFDKNNNLYIGYSDSFYSGSITVKKFNFTNWVNVGSPGFTANGADYISLETDTNGTPYVASRLLYNLTTPSYLRANVVKFTGSNWVNVGPSWIVSERDAYYTRMLIDKNNLPVICYIDENRHSKVAVKKFNGLVWDFIGDKGFSIGYSKNNSHNLEIDKNGIPYACFSDSLNGFKATVMKYFGGSWSYVGSAGFTSGSVDHMCLKFDTLNVPYISFTDGSSGSKQSVMKFNGSTWNYIGSPGFSPFPSCGNYLTFYNNTPYIVSTGTVTNYRNVYTYNGSNWVLYPSTSYNNGGNLDVKIQFDTTGALYLLSRNSSQLDIGKYNGTSWQSITTGLGSGNNADFFVEKSGVPYVISSNVNSPFKVSVRKYTSSGWASVGGAAISYGAAVHNSIIDVNGTKYIAYSDKGYGYRTNFLKFNGINWVAGVTDSAVSAGTAFFTKLAADNSGNIYLLHKSTESYAKKIGFINNLSITTSPVACSGQTMVLTASGASSYTWNTSAISSSIVITPTGTTNYYVNAFDPNNCVITALKTITVLPLPVLNVSGAGNLCIGNSTTLTATGANTYTWLPSTISNSMVVSPTVSTVYTVAATSAIGCENTKTVSPVILQLPVVNAVLSNSAICQNASFSLTATGATYYYLNNNSMVGNTSIQFPVSTSSYTLLGVDGNNCANTHIFTITVNSLPVINISPSSWMLCTGQTVTLQATGANTYTWNSVPGGSVYIDSPTSNTNYILQGTNQQGCTNSSSVTIIVSVCTAIENNIYDQTLTIYPNPSSGSYVIKSTEEFNKIIVFNATGQIINNVSFENINQINLFDWPNGIYLAKIFFNNGSEKAIRLIKE